MSRQGRIFSGLTSGALASGHNRAGVVTYAKPQTLEEIGELRRQGHKNVLIEASAGTGKTFVLEHMVVDLLLGDGSDGADGGGSSGLDMSQILVVTFTEQAAAELRSRLGKKLAALLALCEAGESASHPVAPRVAPAIPAALSRRSRAQRPGERAARSAAAAGQLSLFDATTWAVVPTEQISAIPDEAMTGRPAASASAWVLDERCRKRLEAAIDALPTATITTIHGFCHQVLTSFAFTSGRLLSQQLTYGRALFDRTFRSLLRKDWTTDESIAPYLEAYLLRGHRMADLADGLHQVHLLAKRCGAASPWARPFSQTRLREAWLNLCAALAETNVDVLATQGKWRGPQRKAAACRIDVLLHTIGRVAKLADLQVGATAAGTSQRLDANLVLALEHLADDDKPDDLMGYLRKLLSQTPGGEKLDRALAGLEAVQTDLRSVLMERMLPKLTAELDQTKRNRGLFDFDDMISSAAELVSGQHGPHVVSSLRRRYAAALIDEFQDTDDVQWGLFRKVFLDSDEHYLFAIGDPKQAIYGFRGADVGTYLKARDHIATQAPGCNQAAPAPADDARSPDDQPPSRTAPSERPAVLSLAENHRATAAMVEACNAVFRQDTAQPFFTGDIGYAQPVRPAQPQPSDRGKNGAASMVLVHISTGNPTSGGTGENSPAGGGARPCALDAASVRRVWAAHIAKTIKQQLASGTWQPSDVFVLTRTTAEGEEMAEALTSAGIPCLHLRREELFQSGEAIALGHVLRAMARPNDMGLRLRCLLTPFFGYTLAELETATLLGDTHPTIDFLFRMHELAKLGAFPLLFAHLFHETGIFAQPELAATRVAEGSSRRQSHRKMGGPTSRQRLRDLHELLLMEAATSGGTLDDLIGLLDAGAAGAPLQIAQPLPGAALPGPGSAVAEKAVRILTLHRAKGLEAKVVFLYGGNGRPPSAVRPDGAPFLFGEAKHDEKPMLYRGAPSESQRQAMAERRNQEEQRLYYVGMTRAKERVYAPIYDALDERSYYAVLQRRLEAIRREQEECGRSEIAIESVVHASERAAAAGLPREQGLPVEAGRIDAPGGDGLASPQDDDQLAAAHSHLLVDAAAIPLVSTGVTSYTKWKRGLEQADPPMSAPAGGIDDAASSWPDPFDLPGGAVTGRVLHEALERVPLETFVGTPAQGRVAGEPVQLDAWRASPVVRRLIDRLLGRLLWPLPVGTAEATSSASDVAGRYRDRIERIVYAAYNTRFPITTETDNTLLPALGRLVAPGHAHAQGRAPSSRPSSTLLRELEILSLTAHDRPGKTPFLQGFIDVVLEHEGRIFVLDWKSDSIDAAKSETVRAHTVLHHELQARFYSLGVTRMLGIMDEAAYASRFAGVTFIYLRHLGTDESDRNLAGSGTGGSTGVGTAREAATFDSDRSFTCTLKPSWSSLVALAAELGRGQEMP